MGFVRHKQEAQHLDNFKGGKGHIEKEDILLTNEEMYNKGRVFSKMTLRQGCEVGLHKHEGDSETYYILSGKGTFIDNGVTYEVGVGDTLYTGDGDEHYLVNNNEEPLEFIALILFK